MLEASNYEAVSEAAQPDAHSEPSFARHESLLNFNRLCEEGTARRGNPTTY